MTDLEQKLIDIANATIDYMCEDQGVLDTIRTLVDTYEFTKEDLIEMDFDEEDINQALEEDE